MQDSIVCSICEKDELVITDPESGEIICSRCGQVVLEKIQEDRQEWRAFNLEGTNRRSRTGMPTSLARHDMGLATVIGKVDKDASGRRLEPSMCSTMRRLRTWDSRTKAYTSTDKSLQNAFNELDKIKDKLALSDATVEKSAYIYRKAQEKGLAPGRTISSKLIAATYIACREMGTPKTLSEIAKISDSKRKYLARTYRLLVTELDLKIPTIDPLKRVVRIANELTLSEKTKRQAIVIMKEVIRSEVSAGKGPMGLAATVVSLGCHVTGETRTQRQIAYAAGVTEVTIRNISKQLKDRLLLN